MNTCFCSEVPVPSASLDSVNSQLLGAISNEEGIESDDLEMYTEEDVLAGDIITTDEVR